MTEHPRQIRSFSRVGGRLTSAQGAAWHEYGHLVVAPTLGMFSQIDPGFRLESVFDGDLPLVERSGEVLGGDVPLVERSGEVLGGDVPPVERSREAVESKPRRCGVGNPVIVEVGSGDGAQAIAYATAHPEVNVVAVEVYREGIAEGLRTGAELANLRFVRADAAALLAHVADGGGNPAPESSPGILSEVWTYFPDPWRKARHAKRRIVSDAFAQSVARALTPGGVWRLATDWGDYAAHMTAVLERSPLRVVPADRAERIVTKYERKAIAAGRRIHEFQAVNDA